MCVINLIQPDKVLLINVMHCKQTESSISHWSTKLMRVQSMLTLLQATTWSAIKIQMKTEPVWSCSLSQQFILFLFFFYSLVYLLLISTFMDTSMLFTTSCECSLCTGHKFRFCLVYVETEYCRHSGLEWKAVKLPHILVCMVYDSLHTFMPVDKR